MNSQPCGRLVMPYNLYHWRCPLILFALRGFNKGTTKSKALNNPSFYSATQHTRDMAAKIISRFIASRTNRRNGISYSKLRS